MAKEYSHQLVTSISFGVTSGVITALGMIVGLHEATSSRLAVFAGIVVMAIADGLADAAGFHVVEEAEMENGKPKHDSTEIWMTTLFTFLAVCGFILTFAIPILIFELGLAILVDIIWGFLLIIVLNIYVARAKKESVAGLVLGHVFLASFVVVISYFAGKLIAAWIK